MFFDLMKTHIDTEQPAQLYKQVLGLGNRVMLVSLIVVFTTIVICYTHYEYFSMLAQVIGHISMILAVTAIKIGYLMRCVGLQQLDASRL